MRTAVFATLLALPLFSGCFAMAAGAVGGMVLSREVVGMNVYETRLNADVSKVWPTVKIVLSNLSLDTIEIDEGVRMAKAKLDGGTSITVSCEAYDLDKTVMLTRAAKYAGTINDAETARLVQERIVLMLERGQ